jgi:hypothetical protein
MEQSRDENMGGPRQGGGRRGGSAVRALARAAPGPSTVGCGSTVSQRVGQPAAGVGGAGESDQVVSVVAAAALAGPDCVAADASVDLVDHPVDAGEGFTGLDEVDDEQRFLTGIWKSAVLVAG